MGVASHAKRLHIRNRESMPVSEGADMAMFRPWFIIRNAVTVMLMNMSEGSDRDLIMEFAESYDRKTKLIEAYSQECDRIAKQRNDANADLVMARQRINELEAEVAIERQNKVCYEKVGLRMAREIRELRRDYNALESSYLALVEREDNRSKLFDRIADMADLAIMGDDEDIANMTKEM